MDIQAIDLKLHINEMKERAKKSREESKKLLAEADAIENEIAHLNQTFENQLKHSS